MSKKQEKWEEELQDIFNKLETTYAKDPTDYSEAYIKTFLLFKREISQTRREVVEEIKKFIELPDGRENLEWFLNDYLRQEKDTHEV